MMHDPATRDPATRDPDDILRAHDVAPVRHAAIVWFTRRNYTRHRAMDPSGLPASFDEWLVHAERTSRDTGIAHRVVIDPAQFSAWCRAAARDTDASARTDFAQIVAKAAGRRNWWRRGNAATSGYITRSR